MFNFLFLRKRLFFFPLLFSATLSLAQVGIGTVTPDVSSDSQYYHLIMENIEVDENEITKININEAGIEILGKHPYIGYSKAKIVLAFIKQHGQIHSFEELQKVAFIPGANIEKLKHYLVFE